MDSISQDKRITQDSNTINRSSVMAKIIDLRNYHGCSVGSPIGLSEDNNIWVRMYNHNNQVSFKANCILLICIAYLYQIKLRCQLVSFFQNIKNDMIFLNDIISFSVVQGIVNGIQKKSYVYRCSNPEFLLNLNEKELIC
jgi:hypothetical protein